MDDKLAVDIERTDTFWLSHRSKRRRRQWAFFFLGVLFSFALAAQFYVTREYPRRFVRIRPDAARLKARCENLKLTPGPPPTFHERSSSDRFVLGIKPTLIRNATIWTGNVDGLEVLHGDILLDKGLIKSVGKSLDLEQWEDLVVIDAEGGWVTPGCVLYRQSDLLFTDTVVTELLTSIHTSVPSLHRSSPVLSIITLARASFNLGSARWMDLTHMMHHINYPSPVVLRLLSCCRGLQMILVGRRLP